VIECHPHTDTKGRVRNQLLKDFGACTSKMNQTLLDKIQILIEEEVRIQVNRYAQIISKRHDISLKLLLRDIELLQTSPEVSKRCLGITGKKTQCLAAGKYDGYCSRHVIQRKVPVPVVASGVIHVGHTIQESLFLAGCPACERSRDQKKLMIEI
jgi:hypothetical protein